MAGKSIKSRYERALDDDPDEADWPDDSTQFFNLVDEFENGDDLDLATDRWLTVTVDAGLWLLIGGVVASLLWWLT